MFMNKVRVNIH